MSVANIVFYFPKLSPFVKKISHESRTKFTKHIPSEARGANSPIPFGARRFAQESICLSGRRTTLVYHS